MGIIICRSVLLPVLFPWLLHIDLILIHVHIPNYQEHVLSSPWGFCLAVFLCCVPDHQAFADNLLSPLDFDLLLMGFMDDIHQLPVGVSPGIGLLMACLRF